MLSSVCSFVQLCSTMSWILSTTCSGPWDTLSSATTLFEKVQEWLAYVFFAQCPQHAMITIIHAAFLGTAAIQNLGCSQAEQDANCSKQSRKSKANWKFVLTLIAAIALAASSTGIVAFQTWENINQTWTQSSIREEIFVGVEALAWITCIIILANERKVQAVDHPLVLRMWWFFTLGFSILAFLSSIFRLSAASGLSYGILSEVSDIYALVKTPICLFLLYVTINGGTGIQSSLDASMDGKLTEPLLSSGVTVSAVSGFASASIFSKATFTWLTPLLVSGAKRSLEIADVPQLAPRDKAENMYRLLQASWPKDPGNTRPLTCAILKGFWPQLLLTGSLQLLRTAVIYAGPLLISSFTDYASGNRASKYDGYVLVILLLLAKYIEVFSYHQYNFQCYRLGNNIRTALVTTLYRKGLRLSSSARQNHGIGQITNYMVVDAQQLSDACLQFHLCWGLPVQVILAMVILFYVIGISAFAGLATMVLIAGLTMYNSGRQRFFQGHLMSLRDTRMRSVTEVLSYMKVIKLQAWEEKFREKVESFRQTEYNWLKKFVIATASNMFVLWNTLPFVSTVTYVTAVLLNTGLTSAKVFTAAAVFRIVQEPIRNFPQAVIAFSQVVVSLERLDKYILSSEIDQEAVTRFPIVDEYPVVVEGGNFAWEDTQDRPTLSDINLKVKRGSLVTIVGSVGSGKTSMLAALLGEMVKFSGRAKTAGNIAYVPQTAWIQNATIEENILFGSIMEHVRYREVLRACALEPDLASMDYGDQTEIGEKGINLSGGQKQRIQLARAVYQNCDIYLLDDVFSAVDAHTGSHLFKECILGLLKGKTILLVTHQVEFLTGADLVVVMKEGKMVQSGSYDDILRAGTDFAALVAAHNQAMDLVNAEEEEEDTNVVVNKLDRQSSSRSSFDRVVSTEVLAEKLALSSSQQQLEKLPTSDSFVESRVPEGSSKLIDEEQRETGRVSWMVYWLYLTKAFGGGAVLVLLLNQSFWQAALLASDYWLSYEIPTDSSETINKGKFISVYVILNAAAWLGVLVRVTVVAAIGLKTAQVFFLDMLRNIFRAPMSFFDTTPSGRILSRFTADQTNLDFTLHFFLGGCMSTYFSALGVIIVISISTWPIVFLVVPLGWLYFWYQKFYITSSREITRLDSITKAPLIYHFSETVSGIETIRCFRKEEDFSQQNIDRVNSNMKMDFHNNSANEWLGLRLESIGTAILCTTAFLFVVLPEDFINTETVGLALSYALGLNSALYWTVWLTCTVENKMVSVERIRQFTNIPSEAVLTIANCLPSPNWPFTGKIVSTRLKLRYRPSTPLVLKGVTVTIEGGEKVGVVGRTGSGKSTLVLAIFRLVEPAGGQILIDDVDIATIGLHDLRSKLGIVPQDPVLFEGTIRMNMDPLGQYTDDEIWRVLEKCQLSHIVQDKAEKLEASVVEYGGNWSVGQRQLLCFGRALLKHSRVLFLDEATASIDAQTDATIQGIIREEFEHCTVVSIAHRIPTVMDSDKVLVMDQGRVKEFDSPSNLLHTSTSLFAALVHEYSSRSGQRDEAA